MRFLRLTLTAFVSSDPSARSATTSQQNLVPVHLEQMVAANQPAPSRTTIGFELQDAIQNWLLVPPAEAAAPELSDKDIELLRQALAAFYNTDGRDYAKAESLLTQAIAAWKEQSADEVASLYRIRADCYMSLLQPDKAQRDYSQAIELLKGPDGDLADPNELPSAYLGRARAIRSTVSSTTGAAASSDYQLALRLSARDDWDTTQEEEADGASRNPYAAWEWGSALRHEGKYQEAAQTHALAAQSFKDIGDKARSVISKIDAGIDLAASSDKQDLAEAKEILESAIKATTSVEGRDIALLQRVIAKEGEGRIALASIEWANSNQRFAAESQLGQACERLDQLDADAQSRTAGKEAAMADGAAPRLKFSIDDQPGAFDVSCSRFKNEKFLSETLDWPKSLQEKVQKLNSLSK